MESIVKKFQTFIDKSITAFHAVQELKERLCRHGFQELQEDMKWTIQLGGSYFVTRNDSSIIAFRIPTNLTEDLNLQVIASHSDSPGFKVKPNDELSPVGKYKSLNTEVYGGPIYATWMDRPLSVAGRVSYLEGNKVVTKLVNLDRDLMIIPNVAIHQNREINQGYQYNAQVDLMPCLGSKDVNFTETLCREIGIESEQLLGKDLFLYVREQARLVGVKEEFIVSPRLDNLECAFTTLEGLLASTDSQSIQVYACFDNEEVGSLTRQGADSTFLEDVVKRIFVQLELSKERQWIVLAKSLMISADNAHAVHPNHPQKADAKNQAFLNEGIVIKYNANQSYTTDGTTSAFLQALLKKEQIPYQFFANRSDVRGGSTLGNLSQRHLSIPTVDLGLPQLAMHSAVETAGVLDLTFLYQASKAFFSKTIVKNGNEYQL